jgi:hypothetical protein
MLAPLKGARPRGLWRKLPAGVVALSAGMGPLRQAQGKPFDCA